jgi:uncharacterized membrane protein YqjE
VLDALQRLTPAVLRHLMAYGELLCEETGEALRRSRRRALGFVVTVAAGVMALALACVLAIAASWDGPNRLWVVSLLCLLFVLVAVIAAAYTRNGTAADRPPFGRLRTEWKADMQQLAQLHPSLGIVVPEAPITPGSALHVD